MPLFAIAAALAGMAATLKFSNDLLETVVGEPQGAGPLKVAAVAGLSLFAGVGLYTLIQGKG